MCPHVSIFKDLKQRLSNKLEKKQEEERLQWKNTTGRDLGQHQVHSVTRKLGISLGPSSNCHGAIEVFTAVNEQ